MKSALAMAHRPMPRGRPNASFRGPRGGDDDDDEPTPAAPALAADSSEERRDAGVSGGDDPNAAASDSEQEHAPTPKVRLDLAAHALDGEVGATRQAARSSDGSSLGAWVASPPILGNVSHVPLEALKGGHW